jgi:hypothetical protein
LPSKLDYEELQKDAQRVVSEFKTKSIKEDSSYIAQESDGGQVNIASYGKKNMIISDSTVFTSPAGTVFGPYTEGAFLKIYIRLIRMIKPLLVEVFMMQMMLQILHGKNLTLDFLPKTIFILPN